VTGKLIEPFDTKGNIQFTVSVLPKADFEVADSKINPFFPGDNFLRRIAMQQMTRKSHVSRRWSSDIQIVVKTIGVVLKCPWQAAERYSEKSDGN
jgi:hypothetical protein